MQVSASLTSVTSGGLLSKNRSAAVAFVGRRNGLLDFMNNRGGELAHGNDSVGMRQFALHLAKLTLATGALQGNGGLRSEVREQGNLSVGKRLHTFATQSNYPD
jgi:hypothetical protein